MSMDEIPRFAGGTARRAESKKGTHVLVRTVLLTFDRDDHLITWSQAPRISRRRYAFSKHYRLATIWCWARKSGGRCCGPT